MKVAVDDEDAHLYAFISVFVAHIDGVVLETLALFRVVVALDFGDEGRLTRLVLTQNYDALPFR